MEKLPDRRLVQRFIDADPIGTLILQKFMKEFPDADIWCDNPFDPQYIYGPFYWFACFHALSDAAADAFIKELPARNIAFGGIRHRWAEKIIAVREPVWHSPCHLIYWPEKECDVPVQHEARSLTVDDAPMVNKYWDLGHGDALDYVTERILKGPSACCEDDEGPVSWAMTHTDGSMGFMYTMERGRRKGYGKSVGISLIKKILAMGETPFGYILLGNNTSLEFSKAQGLKTDGFADYLELPEVDNK